MLELDFLAVRLLCDQTKLNHTHKHTQTHLLLAEYPVHLRQDDRSDLRDVLVGQVTRELRQDPHRSVDRRLLTCLEGGHQEVKEAAPLVRPVPVGDGGDSIGH